MTSHKPVRLLTPKKQLIFYRYPLEPLKGWYLKAAFLPFEFETPCALSCRIWNSISSVAGGHDGHF